MRGLGGLGLDHALLEFVHAPGGVHELLLAGVKRMAGVADADDNRGLGRAGLDDVAARATDLRFLILRVNVSFHKRPQNIPVVSGLTSGNFLQ